MGLRSVLGDLFQISFEWKAYTKIHTLRTADNQDEAIQASNDEETHAVNFITQLKAGIGRFEELEALGLNKIKVFSEAFAEIKNILGHYEEMTNGSLIVPENAEFHIKAHDPKINIHHTTFHAKNTFSLCMATRKKPCHLHDKV